MLQVRINRTMDSDGVVDPSGDTKDPERSETIKQVATMPRIERAMPNTSALAPTPAVRLAGCPRCGWNQPLVRVHRRLVARRDRCGHRWLCSDCLVDLTSPRPAGSDAPRHEDAPCHEFEYAGPVTHVVARSGRG